MKHRQHFEQLLEQRAASPFEWGVTDCALWAFDAVRAATGRDPAADLRGTYSTALQAARKLQLEGGWPKVCAARIGRAVLLEDLQDGDVVQVHPAVCSDAMAGCGALAVYYRGWLVAQGATGLVRLDAQHALGAWRPA